MENQEDSQVNSILSFKVGNEVFAAEVKKVLHILELLKITHVPQCPEYMLGVINLRGAVLPVIDSRLRFGIPLVPHSRNTCIIVMEVILEEEQIKIGILVDSVLEVIETNISKMQAPPSIGHRYKSDFIKGIVNHGDDFIMLLNLDNMFSSDELLVVKEAATDESVDIN